MISSQTIIMLRNPEELESGSQQVYVMINCEDGAREYVMEELESIKCVKEMTTTTIICEQSKSFLNSIEGKMYNV